MSNKDSAAQVCIHCGHERKHCHPISGKCFYGYEPPYTNPGCGCKCSFSEAAASEGVPPPERIWTASTVGNVGHQGQGRTWYSLSPRPDTIEYARVRASVDGAGLGPFDDSQPVLAALSRLMDDGDATDNQRRTARMALKELAKRSPVDEAVVRRIVEKIVPMLDPWLIDMKGAGEKVAEIITTELQKGK